MSDDLTFCEPLRSSRCVPSPPSTRTLTFPRDRARNLVLLVSCGGRVTRYPLRTVETIAIGRTRDADVSIDDESVSRKHCTLQIAERIILVDEKSRNGTFVMGKRIERTEIAPGTAFDVGAATIMVCYEDAAPRPKPSPLIARDPAMRALADLVNLVAPTSLPVLIYGETGTGKEVVAEALHARSDRSQKPFVRINCAAMAETLLESELFGSEKGAFTGATTSRGGLFEAADKGTLFFDEIGEMPASMQAKLLRVLESGEVMRVGSVQPRKVDVRFIAATHRDLMQMVVDGSFRQDLFYRLNGFALGLPPLRERAADIPALAEYLLDQIAAKKGTKAPRLSDAAMDKLRAHPWPGNVRELRTALERAAVLAGHQPAIEPAHILLDAPVIRANVTTPNTTRSGKLDKAAIERALASTFGNQKEAAKLLGVSRPTLLKYIDLYGLGRPRKR